MTETIEQLINELERCAGDYRWNPPQFRADMTTAEPLKLARSALLSCITQIQQEADEWKKRTEKLEAVTLISTRELTQDEIDYAEIIDTSDAENKVIASLRKEADEWKTVASMLADELTGANPERFPVSWEDVRESSHAWTAYVNLRDRISKISQDNNKPDETTIKMEGGFTVCQKCRFIVPPQMMTHQYYYCPNCGRKITDKREVKG